MKKLTTKSMFGMLFAIPLFIIILIGSIILTCIIWILSTFNIITGTGDAFDWILFRSKEIAKRNKFRSLLMKIDREAIK